jgi:hypothetical protein
MGAGTYPDEKVILFINQHLVPLRLRSDAKPYAEDFNIRWTPSIIILDTDGKEHYRTLGFFSPEELIPSLYLGIARTFFDHNDHDRALVYINNLLTEYPKSDSAPEAVYIKGVCGYKITDNPKPLKEAYEELNAKYTSSLWTKRAYPYRLL